MRAAARFGAALLPLAAVFLVAAASGQQPGHPLPDFWENWRYSRALELDPVDQPRLVRVTLPVEVLGRSLRSLADLRVLDDQGRETGYVLFARRGRTSSEFLEVDLVDTGSVPGRYTQAVVDTGTGGEVHNTLLLDIKAQDFFARAEVAASDDRSTWRILLRGSPVFAFGEGGSERGRTIHYPDTRSRWLRLRLRESEKEVPVTGVRVSRVVTEEPELQALGAESQPLADLPEGQSGRQADLGHAHVPVSVIRLETPREAFRRAVRVRVSEDGENWSAAGSGEIFRFPADGGRPASASLEVGFTEKRGRYWQVVVLNRSDAPIEDLRFTLYGVPRHVVFRQQPGRNYRLLFGHRRGKAPHYEFARLTSREQLDATGAGRLGLEEENSKYLDPVPPPPWTERHPVVLWLALGLAVGVLGWLAISSLRQAPPPNDS